MRSTYASIPKFPPINDSVLESKSRKEQMNTSIQIQTQKQTMHINTLSSLNSYPIPSHQSKQDQRQVHKSQMKIKNNNSNKTKPIESIH